MRGLSPRKKTEPVMRVATRAFLVVAVLFWLIAPSLPSAAAPEGAGPPDHGDRGRGKGDSNHDHGSHGPGSGDHGPGNRDHGPGMVSHGPGNENPGGNGNGGHEPPPPPPPSSGKGPCGAQTSDADQVAAVRAMVAEQCDCASASNRGHYMKCVAQAANAAVRDGSLRAE